MDNEVKIKHKLSSPNESRWKNSKETKDVLVNKTEGINVSVSNKMK